MALGLRDYARNGGSIQDPNPTRDLLQALFREFSGEFGTRRCFELTGYDLTTPEGMELFHKSDIRDRCTLYVGWVCDRIAPLLA